MDRIHIGSVYRRILNRTLPRRAFATTARAAANPASARPASPLRQLQLDAAIAGEGFLVGSVVDRLERAETGGGEEARVDAVGDEILNDRDGARGGELPVRLERPRSDRLR